MNFELIFFSVFLLFIMAVLSFDLGIFDRKSHTLSLKEAITWTIIWVSLAIGFYLLLFFKGNLIHGINDYERLNLIVNKYHDHLNIGNLSFNEAVNAYNRNLAIEFISGYLVEYTLSADNIFIIILIFMSFGIRRKYHKRVLVWGILGAIIMRFIFIFISSALIQKFYWFLYILGAFLIFTGIRMFLSRNKQEKIDTQNHPVVKFASKFFNIFPRMVGQRFYIIKKLRTTNNEQRTTFYFTPLFIVLLVIEFSDVIFAVDSVPAVFSVTRDPYIVFFSNIFAILGLRSLFFLISDIMNRFRYLKVGLSALLTFVGFKMLFNHFLESIHFTTLHSFYVILSILAISIISSLIIPVKDK